MFHVQAYAQINLLMLYIPISYRHSSVKQFLQARVHFLQCKTKSVEVLRSLYECHQLLRNEEDALHCIEVAYQMDITNKEIEWQRLLAKRQYEIRQMQEVLLKRLESDSEADLKLPQSIPVSTCKYIHKSHSLEVYNCIFLLSFFF